MNKSVLWTLIVVFAVFGAFEMYVASQYEYHNDRLNHALGVCIGVTKMRKK